MSGWKWVIAVSVGALVLFSLAQAQNANQPQPAQPGQRGPGAGPGPGGPGGPGGGFNWEEFRERQMNDLKDQLGSADDEWKVLRPKIEKVQTAQMQSFVMPQMGSRRGGPGGGGPGGGPQGGPGGGRPQGGPGAGPGGPGGFGGFQESKLAVAQRELGDVLQNKDAPAADVTRKLAAFRETRDKARAELQAARKDLKELVTPRQEALLVLRGYLE